MEDGILQLVSEAFNVIAAVGDNNVVFRKQLFHRSLRKKSEGLAVVVIGVATP